MLEAIGLGWQTRADDLLRADVEAGRLQRRWRFGLVVDDLPREALFHKAELEFRIHKATIDVSHQHFSVMFTVVETEAFSDWLEGLKDSKTRIRLVRRINKASRGLFGDVKPVGEGVFEMREFFGPGWRMYYVLREGIVILMLGGGDKATQDTDIERARQLAQELKNDQEQDPGV